MTISEVESVPEFDEVEWHRQMRHAFASSTAYPVQHKGKMLWLVVRRSLLMVISAFDLAYGIETKKR